MDLLKTFATNLAHWTPKQTNPRYLVAVSGGRDSMVLLDLCRRTLPSGHFTVAHFNHKTRGGESDRDATFIERYCNAHSIPFVSSSYQKQSKSEAAMRTARLLFLERARKSTQSKFILTAHHANDNLETFLMRLIRGTSIQGLSGIKPKNGHTLKPLIKIPATAIDRYAKDNRVPFRHDTTNDTLLYFRNRIRHQLTPELFSLAEEYGGEGLFLSRFSSLTEDLRDVATKEARLRKKLFSSLCQTSPFWLRLSLKDWSKLRPRPKTLVISEIGHQLLKRSLTRREIRQLCTALEDGKSGTSLRGLRMSASCEQAYFFRHSPKHSLHFKAEEGRWSCADLSMWVSGQRSDLECRFFQPGDTFGKTKLKKLLLAQRVPKWERPLIPVIVRRGSSKVVWHPFAVNSRFSYSISFPFCVPLPFNRSAPLKTSSTRRHNEASLSNSF